MVDYLIMEIKGFWVGVGDRGKASLSKPVKRMSRASVSRPFNEINPTKPYGAD
jgi:hypothetical protein